jgi:hypothetical protein
MVEDNELKLANPAINIEGLTLKESIKEIASHNEIVKDDAAEYVYWEIKKKYRLRDLSPPKTYFQYFISLYNAELWAIFLFAFITYTSINFLPQNYPIVIVRYICTFLLLLILPGKLLIDALTEGSNKADLPERLALSLILSFLLSALVGFALILANLGFNLTTIVSGTLILTTGLAVAKSVRGYTKLEP